MGNICVNCEHARIAYGDKNVDTYIGCSFLYKARDPSNLDEYLKILNDIRFSNNEIREGWVNLNVRITEDYSERIITNMVPITLKTDTCDAHTNKKNSEFYYTKYVSLPKFLDNL